MDGTRIFVTIVGEDQWQGFCRSFGREVWLSDPQLANNQARVDNRSWLIPEIADILNKWSPAELCPLLERLGLPFAPVNAPSDLFTDPHLLASGGLMEIRLSDGRPAMTPALPIAIDGERMKNRFDPPRIGEHTREVLAGIGYDEHDIAALAGAGTVTVASATSMGGTTC
jgi:crotonobetainyl-CoA:carnitine CoA-transferase CaiB-like acyl-CoA transferase